MEPRGFCLVVLIGLTVAPCRTTLAQDAPASRSPAGIEHDLKSTMTENIRATEAEDLVAMMKTIHLNSPVYNSTRQAVSQVFGKYTGLKYELISLKYLAVDGDYAMARVRQRTTMNPPVKFRNNEIDMIVAFKKEDRNLEIWNQAILEVRYLSPQGQGKSTGFLGEWKEAVMSGACEMKKVLSRRDWIRRSAGGAVAVLVNRGRARAQPPDGQRLAGRCSSSSFAAVVTRRLRALARPDVHR